jgi:exonuclease SbcD
MSRIAFTADLHIDAYGQRIDPQTGLNARLVDDLATLRWSAAEALRQGCDALVVAGDFTERRHPSPWLVGKIAGALGDKLVLLRGNHDGEIAGESIVTVLGRTLSGEDRAFARPGVAWIGRTAICCIPYLDRHWLRAQPGMEHIPDDEVFGILADQIVAIAGGLYAQALAGAASTPLNVADGVVLVLHQTLAGAHMSETQQAFLGDRGTVVDAGRLAAIGFEGIVAGHLHRHQMLEGLACPVVIPGSIERVDFGEEREIKGFVIADVGPGRFDWRFVETPTRRFVTIDGEDFAIDAAVDQMRFMGAIVRVHNLPPEIDAGEVRRFLESHGAFEVAEIRRRPMVIPELAGGLSEAMSPGDALETFFRGDDDEPALVEEGRRLLAEVAS